MSSDVGIVCGRCDWFNPKDRTICEDCGNEISLFPASRPPAPPPPEPTPVERTSSAPSEEVDHDDLINEEDTFADRPILPEVDKELLEAAKAKGVIIFRPLMLGVPEEFEPEPQDGSEERQMDQARHYVCKSCYSPIPGGHKFCGKCGAPTNFAEDYGTTQYFGAMQVPNKAKLILIKGEGLDGISYHLNSTEHVAGRQEGAILFPDDTWLSPKHANFFYREDKLYVSDEQSLNGVYLRIRGSATLTSGQMFMCGDQLLQVEDAQSLSDGPESDGTYFYASPTRNWKFSVTQILPGGAKGTVVHDEDGKIVLGREETNMNFINDRYISLKHAQVEGENGQYTVTDLDSQNGTFVRIDQESELVHGDYIFLGKQLLRVEVTP